MVVPFETDKMKVVLLFLATAVYTATAVPAPSGLPRFIEVPGDDGETITVDLQVEPNVELLNDLTRHPGNIYHLFTRRNPTVSQVLDNTANSILSSNFNPAHTTIAIAHGYTQSANSNLNAVIRNAYLGAMEANVIVLDWSVTAQLDYATAILSIPSVGQGLGNFLEFISTVTGAPLTNMHLAGFSLGSHVVGNAGRTMSGRAARVTGLDPFSPIWLLNPSRLARTDALYVEAIHTSGNEGDHYFADVDYFVNGGDDQPGCWLSLCSHNRSWEVFAATVTFNHLWGNQCSTAAQIKSDTCSGSVLPLGNSDVNKRATGMYRVNTLASYPY